MSDIPIIGPGARRSFIRKSAALSIVGLTSITGCLTTAFEHTETPTLTPKPIPTFDSSNVERFSDVTLIESHVHEATNQFRTEEGRRKWAYDDDLARIARVHSRDMAERGYFSHQNPEGKGATERCEEYGYVAFPIGENIARWSLRSETHEPEVVARNLVGLWKRSAGHRQELLSDRYVEEGVGIYITTDRIVYATSIHSGEDEEVA